MFATPEHNRPDVTQAVQNHLYKAKLVVFSVLLVVGVIQIILREHFPQIKPPWPLIGAALIGWMIGYIVVPPIVLVMRSRKP